MNRKERRAFAKQTAKQVCSEKKITNKVKRKHMAKMFFTFTMPKGQQHELATSTEEAETTASPEDGSSLDPNRVEDIEDAGSSSQDTATHGS